MTPARSVPVSILMYHEIAPRSETASRLAVSPEAWSAQLAFLADEGYQTVTAAELSAVFAGRGQLPDRSVVLTFDDGYADFHSRAMPLLDRYGFRATVFVTTGWVEDAGPLRSGHRPGKMLSWSQIAEAAQAGMEVAAHSHSHPKLDQLPHEALREELYASKAQLEDKLGSDVGGLAYPFGYSSAKVRQMAQDLGHDYACAVSNVVARNGSNAMALPRLTIRRSTGMLEFGQIVRGSGLRRIFLKDRMMTKGWAMVRRTRAAVGGMSRGR